MRDVMLQGDCLEIMPTLPDRSVDMILCDLPYGKTAAKWDSIIPLDALWKQYQRIIKPRGAIVLTAVQPFSSLLVMSNVKIYRHSWVWIKTHTTGFQLANIRPLRQHEDVLVFGVKSPNYYPIKTPRSTPFVSKSGKSKTTSKISFVRQHDMRERTYTDRHPTSLLYFAREAKGAFHPTQKPVALFEYLIRTYTQPGAVVLDNCSGSGTTAVACLNTDRHYICIERDPDFHAKSVERVRNTPPRLLMEAI